VRAPQCDVPLRTLWQPASVKALADSVVKNHEQEDEKVTAAVAKWGTKQWARIAAELPGRRGKQCRERWHNHLDPDISKESWSEWEDNRLLQVARPPPAEQLGGDPPVSFSTHGICACCAVPPSPGTESRGSGELRRGSP